MITDISLICQGLAWAGFLLFMIFSSNLQLLPLKQKLKSAIY